MAAVLLSIAPPAVLRRFFITVGLIFVSSLCCPASCSCLARPPPPPSPSKNNNYYYFCDWCPRHSTASPGDLDALLRGTSTSTADGGGGGGGGACGYASMAADLLGLGGASPHVAAAGAEFFSRDGGAGCGACYQLRCRDRRVCGDGGVKVVVVAAAGVGAGNRNRTGFVLTREAFAALARPGSSMSEADDDQLLPVPGLGNNAVHLHQQVDVDFRRIPCELKNRNLSVRVEEGSRHPGHLAISFLYQGGQTDIGAVEIAQSSSAGAAPSSSWRSMSRVRGRRGGPGAGVTTWRTTRAPAGPLRLRLVVTAGLGGKWLHAVPLLPADWRPGQVHDTGLQVHDVALSTCARSCRVRAAAGAGGGGSSEELIIR